jgi:hypothetical protein
LAKRGPKAFPVIPWLRPSVYRIVRMLETVPGVWGTSYGREVYLRAEKEEITLKQGAIEMCFPLIRW